MEFYKSQTKINLARSFAGEAQAGLRYQFIAEMCENQGYTTMAEQIKGIAKNETQHAKVFFDFITEKYQGDIEITADYPFEGTTIEEGLLSAIKAEAEESNSVYPSFAEVAEKEGFTEIADKYRMIARVEEHHKAKFKYLYENFKEGNLFKREQPTMWECSQCGYIETRDEAWDICPLCSSSQGFVELKNE